MTRVKICGITNIEDARCAASAGADLLGFIFYPRSARYITPARAGEITRALQAEFGLEAPRMVGVFVDAPVSEISETAATAGLDLAQLHGVETPEMIHALCVHALRVRTLRVRAFKAIPSRTLEDAEAALNRYVGHPDGCDKNDMPSLLIDAYHPQERGGTGLRADVATAQWLSRRCRLLLAGGLTPENVNDAITLIKPWGVDVSSGVEVTKGIKRHTLVRDFVAAVRATDRQLDLQGAAHDTDN
ncbi:MAG: phosphoribosylanthranilate isomerase [Anaerolineae bacterium]|nr:phosphoribosylanthranilate isomerase [Anaerolineae bacterium]